MLVQILGILGHAPGKWADLQVIDGVKNAGANGAAFNVTEAKSAILVNQSVTGLFSNSIDLKTFVPEENA